MREYGDRSQPDGRQHEDDGRMKRICRRNGVAALSLLFAGLVLPGLGGALPGGDTPLAPASAAHGFSPAFVKRRSKRRQSFGNGLPL